MKLKYNGDWGLGIGDWGLGNPQSPIPRDRQAKIKILIILNLKK